MTAEYTVQEALDQAVEHHRAGRVKETRKLLEFCGLYFDKFSPGFHKTDRAVLTPGAIQPGSGPIYKDSLGKWQR